MPHLKSELGDLMMLKKRMLIKEDMLIKKKEADDIKNTLSAVEQKFAEEISNIKINLPEPSNVVYEYGKPYDNNYSQMC